MRSLVVARWWPWPPRSGAQLRSSEVVAALASLGSVDVFHLADPRYGTAAHVPPGLGIRLLGAASRADRPRGRAARWAAAVRSSSPEARHRVDATDAREAYAALAPRVRYDLAWFVRIESWWTLGALVDAPAVVDYDDLRDRPPGPRLPTWPGPDAEGSALRRAARSRRDRNDAAAWARTQRRVAQRVGAVVVCSDGDLTRLGVDNAVVVPNGFDLAGPPVGRGTVGDPPTICFHGSLAYGPNVDAAERLVRDVLPRVRRRLPAARVMLVGYANESVGRLATVEGVTVTGPVEDMATTLARADLVAVPLREGAGTRIKVLEALAHRIPVVATSVAVEGLDVESGRHVELADDPERFAAACVEMLIDDERRRARIDAGAALVRDRYPWSRARDATVQVARRVSAGGSSSVVAPSPPSG